MSPLPSDDDHRVRDSLLVPPPPILNYQCKCAPPRSSKLDYSSATAATAAAAAAVVAYIVSIDDMGGLGKDGSSSSLTRSSWFI